MLVQIATALIVLIGMLGLSVDTGFVTLDDYADAFSRDNAATPVS